ncbi:hypothetical protein ACEQ8H_006814 [Pleosporales sp. CAS-2024a]
MTWTVFKCAQPQQPQQPHLACQSPIKADTDIAGIGVVVSFLITTCLAFLIAFTVIFLDRYENIITWYRKYISRKKDPYEKEHNSPYWRSTHFWSRVLSKNLLAFSDTQLLTGLAIQFTGLLKHCSISVYHWKIITELAFLTTVTHLLTVIALRNYFVKHRWINLPRIIFMLANLAFIGYTSYISYSYEKANVDESHQLACYFRGKRPQFTATIGTKWTGLLIGAIGSHVTVILAMYCLETPEKGGKKEWYYRLGAAFRT